MELGIIGSARSGKTSLFNAVTGGSALVGSYSSTVEPVLGTVRVPDDRVDALAEIFGPARVTFAEIRWVDYPVAGFGPSGPGTRFVADLAKLDALVHVVRMFDDPRVSPPQGTVDPERDLETIELELQFADLALVERRLERIGAEMRSIRVGERSELERDQRLMMRLQAHLEGGAALRSLELSADEALALRNYRFVTRLPQLVVVNIGEEQLPDLQAIEAEYSRRHVGPGAAVAALCAKIEAELAAMEPAEAREFRGEFGLDDSSALARAIVLSYDLLGLHSFLTAGEDECRAWPVRQGATAPEAAGKIHTDLERGFIRAEVAAYRELIEAGSMPELKRRGQLRTEGKSYVVRDGDVLNILFSV